MSPEMEANICDPSPDPSGFDLFESEDPDDPDAPRVGFRVGHGLFGVWAQTGGYKDPPKSVVVALNDSFARRLYADLGRYLEKEK